MATIERFEDLEIWQRARKITNRIYDFSNQGDFGRDFGLRDQMRRAAVSILSNIAEGFESATQKTFINYLSHAKGSAGELRAQAYIALDRQYLSQDDFTLLKNELEKCSRQIQGFIRYLESKPNVRRVREEGTTYEI